MYPEPVEIGIAGVVDLILSGGEDADFGTNPSPNPGGKWFSYSFKLAPVFAVAKLAPGPLIYLYPEVNLVSF